MRWLHTARIWRLPLLIGLLTLAWLVFPFPGAKAATTRHITLDASQFAFSPGRVHVNQGDRVVFTVAAQDVVHGFYLDGYGLKTRVEPGVSQQIEFVADKTGKFRYRCSVNCGSLHPFMIGELVVGSNTPFWRATGLIVLAAIGMLVYLWQSGRVQEMKQDGTLQSSTP
ncbi:MAG: cupredoxin domain-containing protein [Chloroflexi bacterium]|nr:cupredoxin domain-containing protein [Chloroflexota bacterium]